MTRRPNKRLEILAKDKKDQKVLAALTAKQTKSGPTYVDPERFPRRSRNSGLRVNDDIQVVESVVPRDVSSQVNPTIAPKTVDDAESELQSEKIQSRFMNSILGVVLTLLGLFAAICFGLWLRKSISQTLKPKQKSTISGRWR